MSPAVCCMCSIDTPPAKNFVLGHCFGPASLHDLLHNPKCMHRVFALSKLFHLYWSGKGVLIISFSSEQLSRFTPSQRSSLYKDCPAKIQMYLFSDHSPLPTCGLPQPLWSSSSMIWWYFMVLQCKAGAPLIRCSLSSLPWHAAQNKLIIVREFI